MKKFIFIIFLLLITFLIGFYSAKINMTGNVVETRSYTYTKAICEGDLCMDAIIYCSGNTVVKIVPLIRIVNVSDGSFAENQSGYCNQ